MRTVVLRASRATWCAFHDSPSPLSYNCIDAKNRGVVSPMHHLCNVSDICRTITQEVFDVNDVTSLVVDLFHKKDALSIVSDVYGQLQRLFGTVWKTGENFRLFKARFCSQRHRFNALGHLTALIVMQ